MRTPRLMAIGLSAGLIATGCSSDEGSEDACSAFCSAFARGNNCGDVIATCPSECSALSTGCPARAEAFFSCLGKLDYSCSAPGQANAAGDGLDYVAVYANSGTLYVNDSQCARLYNEFVNCGAGGQGGAGGDAGASQGGLGGGGTGGVGGSGAGGSGAGGSGDGGVGGGGSSGASGAGGAGGGGSGGTPDLANVTFHLNYTTTPADPNGEGGPAVPYKVQVCIDPSDNGYIRVDNIGSASAGSFYAAILWVKDYPATGTIVDSCAPFSSSQALAPGYNVSWENAYCCDLSDTFSTFDANPRRIVVYADALEQVSESDESNNSASSEVFEP